MSKTITPWKCGQPSVNSALNVAPLSKLLDLPVATVKVIRVHNYVCCTALLSCLHCSRPLLYLRRQGAVTVGTYLNLLNEACSYHIEVSLHIIYRLLCLHSAGLAMLSQAAHAYMSNRRKR